MTKLIFYLAVAGLAYWYWSGPYQASRDTREIDVLRENAAIMQRCIKQEERMQAAGGLAGVALAQQDHRAATPRDHTGGGIG